MSYIGFKADLNFPDAHMTMLYLGPNKCGEVVREHFEAGFKNFLADPFNVAFTGDYDEFGPMNDTPVAKVVVPIYLFKMRTLFEQLYGNGSQFLDWNPHITLPKPEYPLPKTIRLTDCDIYD